MLPWVVGLGSSLTCARVDGGAVEVSWALHSAGYAIDTCACTQPPVALLRLDLTPETPNLVAVSYQFPCERRRGATPFEIPPGRYLTNVTALTADGQPAGGIVTPPPVVTNVVWGKPSSLDAQLIEAPCAPECANKNGPCRAQ